MGKAMIIFNKKQKDLTIEERRVLDNYKYRKSRKFKNKQANSVSFKMFGKSVRALTPEEKKIYDRDRKRLQRQRAKEGIFVGRGYSIKEEQNE